MAEPVKSSGLTEWDTTPIETSKILRTLIESCKSERESNKLKIHIENDAARVCFYSGLPSPYIKALYGVDQDSPKLDLYHKMFIFKCMQQSYSIKKSPTYSDLHLALKYDGKKIDIHQLTIEMMSLGYEVKKINGYAILMENPKYTFERFHYLKKIINARESKRNIYYIDERVIKQNDFTFKKPPIDWKKRNNFDGLILCYVISSFGYTNGLFYMKLTKEDLMKWFIRVVLPNLISKSIVVFDNNFYSSISDTVNISRYHSKDNMLRWLKNQNIPCDGDMQKAELYELIEKCTDKIVLHKFERILKAHGHEVLHLPLSIQELSPGELLWKDMRVYLRNQNSSSIFALKEEISRRISITSIDKWSKYTDTIQSTENSMFELHKNMEKALDTFISSLDLGSNNV